MTAPPAAHKVERVEHIDHGAGINVAHQLDNVLTLVGRDNGVQQVHLFAAVSADDLGAANAVLKMVNIGGHDLVRLARRDLQRHAIVATIEAVNGLGRNKLEHDGVRRLVPAKHKAKDRQDKAVETKDDAPDGLARVVGDPQRDKVGAAGGCAGLERDGSAQTRDHAAKNDEHDLVAQKRGEVKDVEEQRREHDLHHREDDEALANAAPA